MAQRIGLAAVILGLAGMTGCTLCCAPFDDHYLYSGGRWVRDNPAHGRVGSAFDPAGHRIEGEAPAAVAPTPAGSPPIAPRRDGSSYLPVE